jgi:hypothetical protein
MGGGGLVARNDKPDAQVFSKALKRFNDHHISSIRNGMDKFHTFGMKTSDQKFSSGYISHLILHCQAFCIKVPSIARP